MGYITRKNVWGRIIKLYFKYKKYLITVFFYSLCIAALNFFQPLVIRAITDKGMIEENMNAIIKLVMIFMITGVSIQLLQFSIEKILVDFHNKISLDLQKKTFTKILHAPLNYFNSKNGTELFEIINAGISSIIFFADRFSSNLLSTIFQMLGGILGLVLLNWKFAIVIFLLFPIRYCISLFFLHKKYKLLDLIMKAEQKYSSWFGDQIAGIRVIKLWNLSLKCIGNQQKQQKTCLDIYKKKCMLDQYKLSFDVIIDLLLKSFLFIFSGYLIIKREFTIGSAFAFITYSSYVMSPMSAIVNIQYTFSDIIPSAKRLFEFWDIKEERDLFLGEENILDKQRYILDEMLRCDNISFGYNPELPIIRDLNLVIYKGKKIGIMGENGIGKSTLVDLILGFNIPQKGKLYFQGKCYCNWNINELRNKIAVVNQEVFLFQTTIFENINLAENASQLDVVKACSICGADDFICRLSDGYDHFIEGNGCNLSGGEKQKIALARAILKNADIWIFDEPISGLDSLSVKAWINNLNKQFSNRTIIMITHNIHELDGFDYIYLLKDGKLEKYND